MLKLACSLAALVGLAQAISWPMILDPSSTGSNVWTSLSYVVHVPPGPPSTVTSGPWFFWCGLQPQGGGVVQPVVQWGENAPAYVNPNAPFSHIYAMVLWDVPADGLNNNESEISNGIWMAQGDVVNNTAVYSNGVWTQTATVTAGQAAGQTTSTSISASQYFHTDSAGDSNANFFVCESELDGSQTNQWNFNVTFTDIIVRAKTTSGVQSLCSSQSSFTDGNGFATISGFSMPDAQTCHFASLTLTPP